jgi:hypothetical protein
MGGRREGKFIRVIARKELRMRREHEQAHQAALSGPYYGPWSNVVAEPAQDVHDIDRSWRGYPQNLFGNWTPDQAHEMLKKCSNNQPSTIYWMDVLDDGEFTLPDMEGNSHTSTVIVTGTTAGGFWNILEGEVTKASLVLFLVLDVCIRLDLQRKDIRVRSLFVDKLTPYVMKILGTGYVWRVICLSTHSEGLEIIFRYNIEPFFFASSFDRKPSRYQEALTHGSGDRKSKIPILGSTPNVSDRLNYYPAIRTSTIIHYSNTIIHFSNAAQSYTVAKCLCVT